ncbi:DUF1284 domain-containing protein [Paracoccus caeni]|uniref:DUF1284 domain-containing protein n=1 Tax=Paracoccus caeni TaxID=657651 RepID=A0A934VXM6_9RHOB|nr:DUF1284 domain-containing protein [Paracoccus caeni]
MLTFTGKGYNPFFVARFAVIARRIHRGAEVEIVSGPDDICAPMLTDPQAHCRNASVCQRDDQAAQDVGALLGRAIRPGDRFPLEAASIARMRAGFVNSQIRAACSGCDWAELCSDIAGARYAGTILPV